MMYLRKFPKYSPIRSKAANIGFYVEHTRELDDLINVMDYLTENQFDDLINSMESKRKPDGDTK